jgi:hypothetical protein
MAASRAFEHNVPEGAPWCPAGSALGVGSRRCRTLIVPSGYAPRGAPAVKSASSCAASRKSSRLRLPSMSDAFWQFVHLHRVLHRPAHGGDGPDSAVSRNPRLRSLARVAFLSSLRRVDHVASGGVPRLHRNCGWLLQRWRISAAKRVVLGFASPSLARRGGRHKHGRAPMRSYQTL